MSRHSVRLGVAELLAGMQYLGDPIFKSVYPVMPTYVSEVETPVAFVMCPTQTEQRHGPQQKIITYNLQINCWFTGVSVGWQVSTPGGNLMVAPDGDPQELFDQWVEVVVDTFRVNKEFSQNIPPPEPVSGRQPQSILIGEPTIKTSLSWPERAVQSERIICAMVMELPATEHLLGI